jgi:hypothetical protein
MFFNLQKKLQLESVDKQEDHVFPWVTVWLHKLLYEFDFHGGARETELKHRIQIYYFNL